TSMSCLPRPPAVSARLTSSVVSALRSPAAFGDRSCDSERPRSASPYPTHVRSQHDQDRSMTPLTESDIHARVARLADLRAAIATAIVGQHEVVEQLLTGLLAGGHCLLEGVPGLGKTLLVRTLGQALELQFRRVQFTPDLMPSDLLGTELLEEDHGTGRRAFRFQQGP